MPGRKSIWLCVWIYPCFARRSGRARVRWARRGRRKSPRLATAERPERAIRLIGRSIGGWADSLRTFLPWRRHARADSIISTARSFRFPPSAEEALIDAVREPGEKLDSAGQPTRGQELMGPATVGEVPRLVGAVLDRKDPWDVLEQMRHQPTIARGSPHPGRDSRDADKSTVATRSTRVAGPTPPADH
jgi:hypothetical protein